MVLTNDILDALKAHLEAKCPGVPVKVHGVADFLKVLSEARTGSKSMLAISPAGQRAEHVMNEPGKVPAYGAIYTSVNVIASDRDLKVAGASGTLKAIALADHVFQECGYERMGLGTTIYCLPMSTEPVIDEDTGRGAWIVRLDFVQYVKPTVQL